MAMLLITHDLGVVAEVADRVAVMYAGRDHRDGPVGRVCRDPRTPTPRACWLGAAGRAGREERLRPIPGAPPEPGSIPPAARSTRAARTSTPPTRCGPRLRRSTPPCAWRAGAGGVPRALLASTPTGRRERPWPASRSARPLLRRPCSSRRSRQALPAPAGQSSGARGRGPGRRRRELRRSRGARPWGWWASRVREVDAGPALLRLVEPTAGPGHASTGRTSRRWPPAAAKRSGAGPDRVPGPVRLAEPPDDGRRHRRRAAGGAPRRRRRRPAPQRVAELLSRSA